MRLTWKDGAATLGMAVVAALYGASLTGADLPLVSRPRVLAIVFLALGIVMCATGAEMPTVDQSPIVDRWATFFATLGTVVLVDAVIVMITGSQSLLAVLVGILGVMWLLTTIRHAFAGSAARAVGRPSGR